MLFKIKCNEQMGEIQLASWGDRLSVLEPWSSLSVTSQRRLLALVNAAVTYLKPQLLRFGTMPRLSWFLNSC